jgi:hypothetical protein
MTFQQSVTTALRKHAGGSSNAKARLIQVLEVACHSLGDLIAPTWGVFVDCVSRLHKAESAKAEGDAVVSVDELSYGIIRELETLSQFQRSRCTYVLALFTAIGTGIQTNRQPDNARNISHSSGPYTSSDF